MFEFVKKLNEIQPSKEHYSSKCIVRNLGWRILIQKKIKDQDDDEFEYVNDSDTNDTLAVKLEVSSTLTSVSISCMCNALFLKKIDSDL